MKVASIGHLNRVLFFFVLTLGVLYVGQTFLIPLAFAGLLAMLLAPVARKLEGWGLGRLASTLLCVLLFLLFVAGFCGILYAQAVRISDDWPQIQAKAMEGIRTLQGWIEQEFGVSSQEQLQKLKEQLSSFSSASGSVVSTLMGGFSGLLTGLVLAVLYLFFLLWKRETYAEFILKLSAPNARPEVQKVLDEITRVSAQYLTGRLLSMAFLAVFYAVGLSIVGLENAILISFVAVIPTLIPYVGAFIGGVFPVLMALVSGSADMFLPTLGVLVAAQVIDNNLIEPLVMGAELDLSPIFTIIAIILGELIWGVPGMILFEPLFAIIRIVCAHVPALHPYRFLLENDAEEPGWVGKLKQKLAR
jgi:predicted PurR-regulated permease PerM